MKLCIALAPCKTGRKYFGFLFFVIAFAGIGVCLYFRKDKRIWELEKE